MAIKNAIRADRVKAGQAIFINFRAAYAVSVDGFNLISEATK